jgi:hypothetical protein
VDQRNRLEKQKPPEKTEDPIYQQYVDRNQKRQKRYRYRFGEE